MVVVCLFGYGIVIVVYVVKLFVGCVNVFCGGDWCIKVCLVGLLCVLFVGVCGL